MGALHEGHVALIRAARAACGAGRRQHLRQPEAVQRHGGSGALSATGSRATPRSRTRPAWTCCSCRRPRRCIPTVTRRRLHMAGPALGFEGDHRPGHFDGVAIVCLKLFAMVAAGRRVSRPEGRAAGRRVAAARPRSEPPRRAPRRADRARPRRARAVVSQCAAVDRGTIARGGDSARARRRASTRTAPATIRWPRLGRRYAASTVDYVGVATFDGRPTLVIAARAGATRLIDNVPLDQPELAGL